MLGVPGAIVMALSVCLRELQILNNMAVNHVLDLVLELSLVLIVPGIIGVHGDPVMVLSVFLQELRILP